MSAFQKFPEKARKTSEFTVNANQRSQWLRGTLLMLLHTLCASSMSILWSEKWL